MASAASSKKRQSDAEKKQNGEVPPDLDQDGKMINPHNPDFITKVPWYLGSSGPTLKHHSLQKEDHVLSLAETDRLITQKVEAQKALLKDGSARGTYRKGACKNCGAMTHNEKNCIERPRSLKKAAWKSGLDIAPDEVSLRLEDHGKVNYSTKRDQWQGYNPEEYAAVVQRFDRIEEERRKRKAEKKEQRARDEEQRQEQKAIEKLRRREERMAARRAGSTGGATGHASEDVDADDIAGGDKEKTAESDGTGSDSDSDSGSDYDSDEDEDEEDDDTKEFIERDENARDFQGRVARQGGVGGAEMKVTTRNLRIREDTPKYLRNLALDSAHYDPKSRSMRANPFPNENPENLAFAGDNFVRFTGDALTLAQTQVLCWEMQARGEDIDLISNPSQAELLQREVKETKKVVEDAARKAILQKYGGQQHLQLDPRIKLGQTEAYAEYSWDGRVVKGAGKVAPRSKYEEDVFINNHTSVWGSFFNRSRMCWGYECCHSLIKNSYCTGVAGRDANDASNTSSMDANQLRQMHMRQEESKKAREKEVAKAQAHGQKNDITKRADIYGESSVTTLDEIALKRALEKDDEWRKQDHSVEADDRRRGFNSMKAVDVTAEDMEAYRMKRARRDDPMVNFSGAIEGE